MNRDCATESPQAEFANTLPADAASARWNPAKSAARLEGQALLLNRRRNAGSVFALVEQRRSASTSMLSA